MQHPIESAPGAATSFRDVKTFDVEAFGAVHGGTAVATAKAGTVVYSQGERADCLYYLQDGRVQVKAVSPQGKEAIIAILTDGGFFGKVSLYGETIREATATCRTDCIIARLQTANVVHAVQHDPRFAEIFLGFILRRIGRLRARLISHLFESSEQRLARILLNLATYDPAGGGEATTIGNLDQEELAQMVGTTRSRINYFMNKFRRLGYIDYNGDIVVRRSLSNALVHDAPGSETESEEDRRVAM